MTLSSLSEYRGDWDMEDVTSKKKLKANVRRAGIEKCISLTFHLKEPQSSQWPQVSTRHLSSGSCHWKEKNVLEFWSTVWTRVFSLSVIQWNWSSSTQVSYQNVLSKLFQLLTRTECLRGANPIEPSSWSSFHHLCKTAWPLNPSPLIAVLIIHDTLPKLWGMAAGSKDSDILAVPVQIVFVDV